MATIQFLLNGEAVTLSDVAPTRSLLDWLRTERGLTGTKEGCNEGDCGACTVVVTDGDGIRALNACILFLPQLHGKAVRTVEGFSKGDDLHPVQQAMIDLHGSQCGFCTPGFVASMVAAHAQGRNDTDNVLAGNLCRCTGYSPIVAAAKASASAPVPQWIADDRSATKLMTADTFGDTGANGCFMPNSIEELAIWYEANPDATLISGATDVGLWVSKALKDVPNVAFLNRCPDIRNIEKTETEFRIGAGVSIEALRLFIGEHFASYGEVLRRFGSEQIRQAATVGGNIGNGSPIGDNPPLLIALGATLVLRKGNRRREVPLEAFFIEYGKQDMEPGEFVETVVISRQPDRLRAYKLSKRFDQDISTVCAAFYISLEGDLVTDARIAFGGMAGTPRRAKALEKALIRRPWTSATIEAAIPALSEDFSPLTDMRGSAEYRLKSAANLLRRACLEDQAQPVSVLEVTP